MGLMTIFSGWDDEGSSRKEGLNDVCRREQESSTALMKVVKRYNANDAASEFLRRSGARIVGVEGTVLVIEVPMVNCGQEFWALLSVLKMSRYRVSYRQRPL
jgi:hypothetical protein